MFFTPILDGSRLITYHILGVAVGNRTVVIPSAAAGMTGEGD